MSNIDCKDPLKIEAENIKLEVETDYLEDDPLRLDQTLSTHIKTEHTFGANDQEISKQRKSKKCDTRERIHRCEICTRIFKSKNNLENHLKCL